MAHFAKISEENVVLQVLTLADKDCQNFGQKNLLEVGQKIQQLQNGSVQQEILLP